MAVNLTDSPPKSVRAGEERTMFAALYGEVEEGPDGVIPAPQPCKHRIDITEMAITPKYSQRSTCNTLER